VTIEQFDYFSVDGKASHITRITYPFEDGLTRSEELAGAVAQCLNGYAIPVDNEDFWIKIVDSIDCTQGWVLRLRSLFSAWQQFLNKYPDNTPFPDFDEWMSRHIKDPVPPTVP
jgi:hypothetical protein